MLTAYALLFTLSAIGISETAYLIRQKIEHKKPVCVIGKSCHQALGSKYNKIMGVPNEIAGFGFYVTASFFTALIVIGAEPIVWWSRFAEILIFSGALVSLYFVYIQWQVIKLWCFWCLMSAFTIWFMAVIVILTF